MRTSWFISLCWMLAFVMLCACKPVEKSGSSAYCEVGWDPEKSERMYFDIGKRVAYSSDTRVELNIQNGDYIGFLRPIPVMMPSDKMLKSEGPFAWQTGSYDFRAFRPSMVSEWIFISVRPSSEISGDSLLSFTALYSLKSGLISFEQIRKVEGKLIRGEFYLCSKDGLKLTKLK